MFAFDFVTKLLKLNSMKTHLLGVFMAMLWLSQGLTQMVFNGQPMFGNEWIKPNQEYHKFLIDKDGPVKLTYTELLAAGIPVNSISANQFKLYRFGQEVEMISSTETVMTAGDYFLFFGLKNRADLDYPLFKKQDDLLNPEYSMYTDKAAYFISWDQGRAKRASRQENDITAPLPKEQYFMMTKTQVFSDSFTKRSINFKGSFKNPLYDGGQGYSTWDLKNYQGNFSLDNVYVNDVNAVLSFRLTGMGEDAAAHVAEISLDGNPRTNLRFVGYQVRESFVTIEPQDLKEQHAIQIKATGSLDDILRLASIKAVYPHSYKFSQAKIARLTIESSPIRKYLELEDFDGGDQIIVYDLTNSIYLKVDKSADGLYKVSIPASVTERELVIWNPAVEQSVSNFTKLKEVNFDNQNINYIILSNNKLFNDGNGKNWVQEYADYRSSVDGGSYIVKVEDVNLLYDVFGFGITDHPIAVRNYFQFIKTKYPNLKDVFIIGKGLNYLSKRHHSDYNNQYNFIPAWGYPGSDIPLVTDQNGTPMYALGRLPITTTTQLKDYFNKVKSHEQVIKQTEHSLENREWVKRIIHLSGGDEQIYTVLSNHLENMKNIIANNQFGASTTTFFKESTAPTSTPSLEQIRNLVNSGVSIISFMGHSALYKLDFNVESVYAYNNKDKYHMFVAMGCYAGDYFTPTFSLSEDYNLAPDRGSLVYLSNSTAGLPPVLGDWGGELYKELGGNSYGKSVGRAVHEMSKTLLTKSGVSEPTIVQVLSTTFNGDPAIHFLTNSNVDYTPDGNTVKINPANIFSTSKNFDLSFDIVNLGAHYKDSVVVKIERQFPNGNKVVAYHNKVATPNQRVPFTFTLPVTDSAAGFNKLFVSLDPDNLISEGPTPNAENNNTLVLKGGETGISFYVATNDVKLVYPTEFSIVNIDKPTLVACNGNTLAGLENYLIELDTTEYFNSPLLKTKLIRQTGGIISWPQDNSLLPGKVYYWRAGQQAKGTDPQVWSTSSFVYLPNYDHGWNQSHFFQFKKDEFFDKVISEPSRKFAYADEALELRASNAFIELPQYYRPRVYFGDNYIMDYQYWNYFSNEFSSVVVSVFNVQSKKMWVNSTGTDFNSFGSSRIAGLTFFIFKTETKDQRAALIDFLKSVPQENIVFFFTLKQWDHSFFPELWEQDGPENIYSVLNSYGLTQVNQLKTLGSVPYIGIFKKGDPNFKSKEIVGELTKEIELVSSIFIPRRVGQLRSTVIGPSAAWDKLLWTTSGFNAQQDRQHFNVYGVQANGSEVKLNGAITNEETDLRSIDAKQYPHLRLEWNSSDSVDRSAPNLDYWRVVYKGLPDIAFNPAVLYKKNKDTLSPGELLKVELLAQNISDYDMDSVLVKFTTVSSTNFMISSRKRYIPVKSFASLIINHEVRTSLQRGKYKLFIELNPGKDQAESNYFNNVAVIDYFVQADIKRPKIDVSFNGKRIIDGEIVSSKSNIRIELTDEDLDQLLEDTSLFDLKLTYPNRSVSKIYFSQTNVKFIRASQNNAVRNTAIVEIAGDFSQDGEYTLAVVAKDNSGNFATDNAYLTSFQIITEQSVSNVFNYPNPFTSKTKFIYTLTGSEAPSFYKIQILTISGKVVREITKEELGLLKVGTNMTEFEYDGTDSYGNKLANGVYLYRFICKDKDGKTMKKYDDESGTDQFFTKEFGKMVIIR